MLKWVAKRLKHVWSNTYETIASSRLTSVVRMRAAVQTNKTSPSKYANKRTVLRFWWNVWWPSNFIKHDQIRSNTTKHDQTAVNTIKHHQTRSNSSKQGVQTGKCLVTKQCLMVFGRQTPSNIVWWPNMLMLKWVAKRLKHVWSNTNDTIDTSRWESVVRGCPNEQNIAHQTREQKKCFTFLIERLMAFKFYQTGSNTTKRDQTAPNKVSEW